MNNNNQNQETVMVNENKKSGKLVKAAKFLGKCVLGVAAAIGVDYVVTGGKGTQYVTSKSKELVKKVSEKKTVSVETPVQNNHQGGGQQRPHYENRPRPNYNGNNNRPMNVVTE